LEAFIGLLTQSFGFLPPPALTTGLPLLSWQHLFILISCSFGFLYEIPEPDLRVAFCDWLYISLLRFVFLASLTRVLIKHVVNHQTNHLLSL